MWAGSRIRYLAPLAIGSEAVRVSRIAKIDVKNGKRGQLVFVTVTHTIERGGSLCIEEEQDLVYLDPAPAGTTTPSPQPAPQGAEHVGAFATDPVLLFRYSALTFNGHRIHYDAPYARAEEGYPDLVVHGPLTATVLQGFASSCRPGEQMAGFRFRGASPIIVGSDVQLAARWNTDKQALDLWAQDANGGLLMEASATFNGAGQQ
jgi:3-methylfumaryl-CoA hydratase